MSDEVETEVNIEEQRAVVKEAAKRVYEIDQKIQRGEVTSDTLRELGEAYQAYVRVRSYNTPSKKKRLLQRIKMFGRLD
jgi:hypothetical protein